MRWRYRILLGWGEIGASSCSSIRRWPGLLGPPIASYSRSRGPGRRSDAGRCTSGVDPPLGVRAERRKYRPERAHGFHAAFHGVAEIAEGLVEDHAMVAA